MENLILFLVSALTALAVENVIFARALGIGKGTLFLKSPRMGILYGALLTWVVTLSSVLCTGINFLLVGNAYIPFVRAPLFFVCVSGIYALTYWFTKLKMPLLHRTIRPSLPVATYNSALFGVLYVSATQSYTFFRATGYALGAGIGYTLALLIIYYARKRLAICPVPRSFRGLPILLLYIGLLSLAIYGLIGHGLPS